MSIVSILGKINLTYYRFFWLVGPLGIFSLLLFGLNISKAGTPYVGFVTSLAWFPWMWWILSWVFEFITGGGKTAGSAGIAISFFGDDDPDSFPLQKLIGYNWSFVVSLVLGIIVTYFFVSDMLVTGQVWMPVSPVFSPGFQVPDLGAVTLFSGLTPQAEAFSNAVLPTVFENPALIYFFIFLFWIPSRFILKRSGVDPFYASIISLFIGLLAAAIIFPYVYHAYAYQAVEFAYIRAFIFVMTLGTIMVLTGFDIPLLIGHFANNYFATLSNLVVVGMVLPPIT